MADIWEDIEHGVERFVASEKAKLDAFKEEVSKEIEAAKQNQILAELRTLNNRISQLEERLPEKEEELIQ